MVGGRRFRRGDGFGRQLDEHEARVGAVPPAQPGSPSAGRLVDSAVYIRGHRFASPAGLAETYACLQTQDHAMAWIGLYRPDIDQISSLAREFRLHDLAVEDAINAHQRPKLERYGHTLFVVLRAARYDDLREEVEFSELHLFIGPGFVVTVRHGEAPDLAAVRRRMEADAPMLARGPEAVLYAILDQVVDGYAPVVAGLENDIDEIETQVFGGDPNASRRIYGLSREVIEFQRAARPLLGMLDSLAAGAGSYGTDEELRRYLRDVIDHLTQVVERVDGFRHLLQNILTVNATLVSQQQNEEMRSLTAASYAQNEELKKVSSWAAILFAPTLIGTVYGMNFVHMPELSWRFGYLFALLLMVLVCGTLYLVFKRRGWL
ncbi:magnesium/cobalt transporter CorA [Micromonospora sp. NPDC051543]|uniref:magnesium/cobalt transporter CorA n=1 Tax=Micromonospora sp. NPDC051543 TaxID=3364287 RepID=UPI0037BB9FD0